MSADFLASTLEIAVGKIPEWDAARAHIETLTLPQLEQAVLDGMDADSLDYVARHLGVDDCKQALLDAVKFLEDHWEEHSFELRCGVLLFVFAGDSWGDPIYGMNEMSLFAASGAAKAAGFMI